MTVLALLLGLWLGLSIITALVFVRFIRGGGGTDAWQGPIAPDVRGPRGAVTTPRLGVHALPDRVG